MTRGHLQPITSKIGLKQGGVLSSLLFNLYIDDIKNIFDDTCDPIKILNSAISHLMYADDLILISTSEYGLKNCLLKLEKFCDSWQLEVNIDKSKVIVFNSSGKLLKGPSFIYRGTPLENVQSYCYLGIDFICSGSYKLARTNLVEKASKAMFPLTSMIAQFNIPSDQALHLFNTMIRPIALYNSENLAHLTHHQISALENKKSTLLSYMSKSYPNSMHQKFMKYILGVKRNCTNMTIHGELGEVPILFHGFISLLSFWHRTSNMREETLVKQTLDYITNNNSLKFEWLATVQYLLKYLDIDQYFQNPHLIDTNNFVMTCKKKLKEKFIDDWLLEISGVSRKNGENSKMRFYKLIKKSFEKEPYLDIIKDFNLRRTISKFRCSDHILEIEVGRHNNIKLEERVCKLCNGGVESEMHFLKDCPKYTHLRSRYFTNPITLDWIDILQCKEKTTVYNVANFLEKAFKIRKELLAAT